VSATVSAQPFVSTRVSAQSPGRAVFVASGYWLWQGAHAALEKAKDKLRDLFPRDVAVHGIRGAVFSRRVVGVLTAHELEVVNYDQLPHPPRTATREKGNAEKARDKANKEQNKARDRSREGERKRPRADQAEDEAAAAEPAVPSDGDDGGDDAM
jgi:hypothetical protein